MNLIFQDQSANDLRLSLVDGLFNKEQLLILCADKLNLSWIVIEAHIIGASHCVSLQIGNFVFNEVFACTDVKTNNKMYFQGLLKNIKKGVEFDFKEMSYNFSLKIGNFNTDGELASLENKVLNKNKSEIGLVYEFPQDDFSHIPKTIVFGIFVKNVFKLKTAHTYPNENKIIYTESIFKLHWARKISDIFFKIYHFFIDIFIKLA